MTYPPTFPERPRILCYAMNGLGLGHLTRLLAIALRIKEQYPQCDILFATTSDADNLLSRYGIPYVHLPSKKVAAHGQIGSRRLARLYNALINPLLDTWQPHVFITDTQVTGSLNDTLHYLRYGSALKVFVHRSRKLSSYTQAQIQAQRFYHLVVVPHFLHQFTVPEPLGFNVPFFWSGPILLQERHEALSRAEARKQLGVTNNHMLVFLSLGGGGDESDPALLMRVLQCLEHVQGIQIVLARGALRTFTIISDHNRVIETDTFPVSTYFNALDMAISASGYNTFHELMHFGVPTIFIPRPRGYDDQLERAEQAAQKGCCLVCPEEDIDTHLPQLVNDLMEPAMQQQLSQNAAAFVSVNGASLAAHEIMQALQQRYLNALAVGDEEAH
jgi:predicted glycosyltransferase